MEIRDGELDTYLFIVADEVLKQKVLNLEPWSVKGQLMVLKQWIPTSLISELDFNTAPFWIQAHGIPPDMITAENAFRVAQTIGDPVEKQSSLTQRSIWRNYLRTRVMIDLRKPLTTFFWLPRNGLPNKKIELKYERLSDFCYKCGHLGHDRVECRNPLIANNQLGEYGPYIRANPGVSSTLQFSPENSQSWLELEVREPGTLPTVVGRELNFLVVTTGK